MVDMTAVARGRWQQGDLQSWSPGHGVVKNKTRFGQRLVAFLRSDEVMERLPGCGWMDGGCQVLAEALSEWAADFPPSAFVRIATVYAETASGLQPQHVVLRVGEVYVDGDGVGTEQDLLRRFAAMERVTAPLKVIEGMPDRSAWRSAPVRPRGAVGYLAKALEDHFGKFVTATLEFANPNVLQSGRAKVSSASPKPKRPTS